jgi:serine/threonine protein phosphatase PrpC
MSAAPLFVDLATRSEKGSRTANEDNVQIGRAAPGWFAVLADGAGGHRHGAEASRRAVQCIVDQLSSQQEPVTPQLLTSLVCQAHADLRQHQDAAGAASDMHTTLVLLWVDSDGRHALWSHVGDSRLYRLRRGVVDMVTRDDSVVQRLVSAGLITPEQARSHPQKNQLVAALGIDGPVDPHTVARPVELFDGDAFLLCSDGWWEGLEPLGPGRHAGAVAFARRVARPHAALHRSPAGAATGQLQRGGGVDRSPCRRAAARLGGHAAPLMPGAAWQREVTSRWPAVRRTGRAAAGLWRS